VYLKETLPQAVTRLSSVRLECRDQAAELKAGARSSAAREPPLPVLGQQVLDVIEDGVLDNSRMLTFTDPMPIPTMPGGFAATKGAQRWYQGTWIGSLPSTFHIGGLVIPRKQIPRWDQ
jgi:hypothetical protein